MSSPVPVEIATSRRPQPEHAFDTSAGVPRVSLDLEAIRARSIEIKDEDGSVSVDIFAAIDRYTVAIVEVEGLADGTRKWTMHIPAEPWRDSDLVLATALECIPKLADEVLRLRAQISDYQVEAARPERLRLAKEFAARNGNRVKCPLCEQVAVITSDCRYEPHGIQERRCPLTGALVIPIEESES
jgi:hypothetical protein